MGKYSTRFRLFQSNFLSSWALSPINNNENSDYFGITTGYIKNPWQVSSNTARGCTTTNTEDIAAAHTRACREPETASRYYRDSSRFFCESTEVSQERHQRPGNGALFAESCFCGSLSVLKARAPRLRQKSLSHNGIELATPAHLVPMVIFTDFCSNDFTKSRYRTKFAIGW